MKIPSCCRAAVFLPTESRIEIREFPLRAVGPDEILVRITLSTICGSDLHTITGRRHPRGPIILGHEICGVIAGLGKNITSDFTGKTLQVGDRITWTIMASCGNCFFCRHGMPQKCENLYKYGHESIDIDPPLNGGFAEYIYIKKGTAVFQLNKDLQDSITVFANCSLATATAAVHRANVQKGDAVLIQGAGLLGLCTAAVCSARGTRSVTITDILPERLKLAESFGAANAVNVSKSSLEGSEFDAVIEVCGQPDVISQGIDLLRIGGNYIIAGLVFPGTHVTIDPYRIITKLLNIRGLHNYIPPDLKEALDFLEGPGSSFPFDRIVSRTFALEDISNAVEYAEHNRNDMRVAIKP